MCNDETGNGLRCKKADGFLSVRQVVRMEVAVTMVLLTL